LFEVYHLWGEASAGLIASIGAETLLILVQCVCVSRWWTIVLVVARFLITR